MLTCLRGGTLYDPTHRIDGEIGDVWFRDGHICAPPANAADADRVIDVSGKVVMAGGIDIHSHIAGGNVNNARVLLPEQHLAERARYAGQPFASAKWSAVDTGYRYAEMGFTTVVEPAVLPINAAQAHAEFADIPIIDKAGLAIVGNDDFLLRLLRDGAEQQRVTDYIAWLLHATRCLGVKVINAGGASAFKANVRAFGLDDEVPMYGVSSRRILNAVQHAVMQTATPSDPIVWRSRTTRLLEKAAWSTDNHSDVVRVPMFDYVLRSHTAESLIDFGAQAALTAFGSRPLDRGEPLKFVMVVGDVFQREDAPGYVVWAGFSFSHRV